MRRLVLVPIAFTVSCMHAAPVSNGAAPIPRPVASNPSGDCNPGDMAVNIANSGVLWTCGMDRSWHSQGAPVQSVNGLVGAVNLTIPTTTSQLTNNSGFLSATYPLLFPTTQSVGYLYFDGVGNISYASGTGATPPTISYTAPNGNTITQQTQNLAVIPFCVAYGVCNGVVDDTAAWNFAISQAHASAVDMIVPIGKTTLVHQPNWQDNLQIQCGKNAVLKESQSAPTGPLLSITFHVNTGIHGCTVDIGASSARTGTNNAGIYVQSAAGFDIDGVTITNSGTPSPSTEGMLIFNTNGGTVENSHVDNTILATHYDVANGTTDQYSAPASILIGSNSLDNLLLIQAAAAGTSGNSLTATIANGGISQPLSFSGTSTALTIHLATDASGNSTSTAGSIIQAFQGDPEQKYFRIRTRDTGTGIVQAAAVQTLSGGVSSKDKILLVNNTSDGSQSQGFHINSSGAPAGTYCNVELSGNTITNPYDWQDYLATSSLHSGQNGNGIDIDGCSGVWAHGNKIFNPDFSGIRIFNGWYNDIGPDNTIRGAGEQSLYCEFNCQGNKFHNNHVYDGLFGVNDNNAEQRTNQVLNKYWDNDIHNVQGTAIQCNACEEKGNTFDGVVIGTSLGGGPSGGYNSQIVDNTCSVSNNPAYPPLLACITVSSDYGGTGGLLQGNHTIGAPIWGHIWGGGNSSGHITNVALGNPTTVTFSTGAPATGNQVCFFGIPLFSTHELNGHCYTATVTGSTFTVPVDSTSFTPWVSVVSAANPNSANGWRFTSFWYDNNPATSPGAFNSNVLVQGEHFKDAVKGTPANGSWGIINDDNCTSGTLSSLGSGTGTNAKYFTTQGWTCW